MLCNILCSLVITWDAFVVFYSVMPYFLVKMGITKFACLWPNFITLLPWRERKNSVVCLFAMQRLFHTLPNLRNFLNSFLHPCFLFPDPDFPESTVLYKKKTAGSLLTKFSNHIWTPSAPMFLFLALQMIGNSCHAHLRDTLKNANFYALRQWMSIKGNLWIIEFHAVMGCRTEIIIR